MSTGFEPGLLQYDGWFGPNGMSKMLKKRAPIRLVVVAFETEFTVLFDMRKILAEMKEVMTQ